MNDEVFNIIKKSVEAMNAEEAYNAIKKSVEAINTRPYATLVEYEKVECIKLLLTAYEKQQKEIEKLKDELKEERKFNKSALETLKECVHKDKIRHIRDKAECMDYYSLNDVIDDLSKLLGE